MLASLLPLYLVRVPREEQMMIEHFCEDYCEYMKRTGRVVSKAVVRILSYNLT